MLRIASSILLGLLLALPVAAAEVSDPKPVEVAAVAAADSSQGAPVIEANAGTRKSDSARESSRVVRGSRQGDPGVRFNNPYAFPLQTLPMAIPTFSSIGF